MIKSKRNFVKIFSLSLLALLSCKKENTNKENNDEIYESVKFENTKLSIDKNYFSSKNTNHSNNNEKILLWMIWPSYSGFSKK